ncbi:hypothetical protein B0P06_004294 [Clostridium saccharoperbutylacetonicum]|uniref:Uncharacterized protein n=1 Tax=Clostridium saccharoperbutylacetonicum N1-4(HMT) TaxID=931276 RepID=M1LW46_9CLOT|nr:hypothetical protein [Clostridium saccharoperbutylacetonicum]AGF57410.1 hypothetical protein Cspa_c36500 [Clostridium saccharoperbutylacetonicum N1-4(HMT)]NRT61826.1 hypothetical protein [Clostridium saccharoperbutylacetonicum]NSB25152.1 hypothetical protein [Clostridium saccharoperbutylacetonicum]NSB44523.1 hypothetical protein [Clostridium saccharoperbutylacetonicum]
MSIKDLLFNKDTVNSWISVFGAFLGTFLAGIVSVFIARWTFNKQNTMQNYVISKNREKGIQMIEEFVHLAIGSLLLLQVMEGERTNLHNVMTREIKKLKDVNFELSNIPSELISIDINIPFQNIRILLKILVIEIENVLINQYESEDKLIRELATIQIERRLSLIIEYFMSFCSNPKFKNMYGNFSIKK